MISGNKIYSLLRDYFDKNTGLVSNKINPDNTIGEKSEVVSTKGVCGCHLAVNGDNVYVANYLSGSVFKTPDILSLHEGHSVNKDRQEMPHPHFVCNTPDNKYICAVDLGIDKIVVYNRELKKVREVSVKAGNGPRHMVFSPDGLLAMLVCELSSTVELFEYSDGNFTHIGSYNCLPDTFDKTSTAAAIRIYKNNVYVSNRGHDSVTVFKLSGKSLEKIQTASCGGESPRDINLVGDILLSANENSNTVTVFKLKADGTVGEQRETLKIKYPQCICFK